MNEAEIQRVERQVVWLKRALLVLAGIMLVVCGLYVASRILLLSAHDLLGSHPFPVASMDTGTELSFFVSRSNFDECTGPIREMVANADSVKVGSFTLYREEPVTDIPGSVAGHYMALGRLHWINVWISPMHLGDEDGYFVLTMQNVGLTSVNKGWRPRL